jgi:hypothetical protein
MGEACSVHERREMHTKFLLKNLKEYDHAEDVDVNGKTISEWILRK